jgi:hypothetical protein
MHIFTASKNGLTYEVSLGMVAKEELGLLTVRDIKLFDL